MHEDSIETQLEVQVDKGCVGQVKRLLAEGADPNKIRIHDDFSLIQLSCKRGYDTITRLLIEAGADINGGRPAPLALACEWGRLGSVKALLDAGAQSDRIPCVCLAAQSGKLPVLKLLLEQGFDVEDIGYYDRTALHAACDSPQVEMVQFLLDQGLDPTDQDEFGKTPLHYAAKAGHLDAVRLLVAAGAYVAAQDNNCRTPLHSAAAKGRDETVRFLLEQGAPTEIRASFTEQNIPSPRLGVTPLEEAFYCGRAVTVRLLIDAGADVHVKDANGRTMLEKTDRRDWATVQVLRVACGVAPSKYWAEGNLSWGAVSAAAKPHGRQR